MQGNLKISSLETSFGFLPPEGRAVWGVKHFTPRIDPEKGPRIVMIEGASGALT